MEKLTTRAKNTILQYGAQYSSHWTFLIFSFDIQKVWSFAYPLINFQRNESWFSTYRRKNSIQF